MITLSITMWICPFVHFKNSSTMHLHSLTNTFCQLVSHFYNTTNLTVHILNSEELHIYSTMDADELFLGPQYKLLKKMNLSRYQETGENCQKCDVDEVDGILSLKKLLLKQPRYERCVALSEAEWDEDLKLAKVTKIAKNLTKNFSHSRDKSMYLYPEECLCLLEMKCLILKWNERKLTIKNAYALLLQTGSGCTFEQFRTYGYLVKLGFRVFKYDEELKNNDYHPKDLTKSTEIPYKRKKIVVKNIKKVDSPECTTSDKVPVPKLESNGWVIISRPSSCYLPHNLQPNYDTYSFNITMSPNSSKITEVIPFYKTMDSKEKSIFSKESIIYDSPKPTGRHPVYEKNILKTVKFEDTMYVPQIKKFKPMGTELNSLPITSNMPSSILNDEKNLNASKYVENIEIKKNSLLFYANIIDYPMSNKNNSYALNHEDSSSLNEVQKDLKDEVTVNLSNTIKTFSNNELEPSPSNIILEDEMINMRINLPSQIKQKLFAIKSSYEHHKSVEKISNIHYDVYYPDNDVPKTSRPAPDFRVIVFEDEVNTFPNVYNVNVSSPNDNVPTLWAIVNSSSVSFYNVNNIILPKSTDWEVKTNVNLF